MKAKLPEDEFFGSRKITEGKPVKPPALYPDGSSTSEASVTLNLTDRLAVRLYEDCCPHCMETAPIQKGLILVLDGRELIEEGMGFGTPVVKYQDKTYFSSSAKIDFPKAASGSRISKTYVLDSISRKKFGQANYINDGVYSSIRKTFAKLYLTQKSLSPIFNAAMELRETAKIKTEFAKVNPRGSITVTYDIKPKTILVTVDFKSLSLRSCEEILVLNEQGSTNFDRYVDSDGKELSSRNIGAWDTVTADEASMVNAEEHLAFSLRNVPEGTLFRGWERTRNRFSWAGLSYSLHPTNGVFSYLIDFFTTKSRGQGFGLAVCKRVIEAHGGTISFESQEGRGAEFIIQLPIG